MFDRCRRCLGMGYKGGNVRGKWRIQTCRRCGGSGTDPKPETLPENKPTTRCPHSACSQHYIDTGDSSCVQDT